MAFNPRMGMARPLAVGGLRAGQCVGPVHGERAHCAPTRTAHRLRAGRRRADPPAFAVHATLAAGSASRRQLLGPQGERGQLINLTLDECTMQSALSPMVQPSNAVNPLPTAGRRL